MLVKLFYRLGIRSYGLGASIGGLFSGKARAWVQGRKAWQATLKEKIAPRAPAQPLYWVHCASLGEFEQARPLIDALKTHPATQKGFILLSFFSPSGYEVRKNYPNADAVVYMPLDTRKNAQDFLDITRPDLLILVKYELWYEHLLGLHERNIPSILISAVFYPKHLIFNRLYGGIFRQILGYFRTIFVQNEDSKQAVLKLPLANLPNIQVAPDTRIDRVVEIAKNAEKLPILEAFLGIQIAENASPAPVFVLGSTHIEDIRFWLAYLEDFLGKNWRIVLVPHEVAPKYLDETLALLQKIPNMRPIRYSQLMQSAQSAANIPSANLLLVDTVGILNRIYQYADLVYVGGGFGGGVHNVLEAAVYGKPCIFAGRPRKISKFVELGDFIRENLAYWINPQDRPQLIRQKLDAFIVSLSLDSAPTTQATRKTELATQLNAYFERKKGGTAQILETIVEVMGGVGCRD